jgi:spectinomycin phosphotransferase
VYTAPRVDAQHLLREIRVGWRFDAVTAEYSPVGFGSHHWIASDRSGAKRFVTLDDLWKSGGGLTAEAAFARLSAAFEAARALRDAGLEFVVAPLADVEGRVLRRFMDAFSIAVFPFLDGDTHPYGEYRSDDHRRGVLGLVHRLHTATPDVAAIAAREDFVVPFRAELDRALEELRWPWTAGPFAAHARDLLRGVQGDLRRALRLFDALVDRVRDDASPWVITHGEPHAANVIWTRHGPRLIDWDTALIAPPGRDLWMLEPGDAVTWRKDASFALYRLRWDVAEVAIYVEGFRATHEATADSIESWNNLVRYSRRLGQWARWLG